MVIGRKRILSIFFTFVILNKQTNIESIESTIKWKCGGYHFNNMERTTSLKENEAENDYKYHEQQNPTPYNAIYIDYH